MSISSLTKPTLIVATIALIGSSALADSPDSGFYLKAFGGASLLSESDLAGPLTGTSGFDTGQVFGGAVGYDYAESPFRSELEFAYRTAEADGAAGITGDFASTTLALNGYYDFKPIAGGRLTPFVGAGLAYVTEIDFDVSGGAAPGEYSDTGVFGYQLMAGGAYPVSDRWSITGELRYFDAGSQSLSGPGGTLSADYRSVDIILGTAFRF
ncbi:outer membrane beta-barrel protein [Cognatiyoonia sp. IB215446]|uniref:outer membrane protein n=1 Tax=Cognatiyoonia sp. IB215446 TaxID=3097355 RepID=UPI002A12B062|nr:outer membrane beta-barrel protein [Cognatiyoonia sp. IB215446]MDX8350659.1 outer membrane beta-barrel protein [Cognatiyoonia sp. IB215446]